MDISSALSSDITPQTAGFSHSVSHTQEVRIPVQSTDTISLSDKAKSQESEQTPSSSAEPLAEPLANKEQEHEQKQKQKLTEAELREVEQLKHRDVQVKAHEQAHIAAAGNLAQGGASFDYQTGPDGKRYAVGGEVNIDTSAVAGDPQATLIKAQKIQRAASAPVDPSAQDRSVAAQASRIEAQARTEISRQVQEKQTDSIGENSPEIDFSGSQKEQNEKNIQNSYTQIQNVGVVQQQKAFIDFFI